MPEPGWYPDPLGSASLRLWTGTTWTEELKDWTGAASTDSPHEAAATPLLPDLIVSGGALGALIGVRLPWVRVGAPPLEFVRYGTGIDGLCIVGLMTVVMVFLIVAFYAPLAPSRVLRGAVAVLGALVALVALVDLWAARLDAARITKVATRVRTVTQPGLYLTLAAGLAIFVGGLAGMVAVVKDCTPRTGGDQPVNVSGSEVDSSLPRPT